jgi:hypothetical protein
MTASGCSDYLESNKNGDPECSWSRTPEPPPFPSMKSTLVQQSRTLRL